MSSLLAEPGFQISSLEFLLNDQPLEAAAASNSKKSFSLKNCKYWHAYNPYIMISYVYLKVDITTGSATDIRNKSKINKRNLATDVDLDIIKIVLYAMCMRV